MLSLINGSSFVDIIIFNDKISWLTLFRWRITVQLPLLWVPQENLSWYSVLNIYHKVTTAVKCRLIDDSVYQNLLILNQDCCGVIWKCNRGPVFFFETQCRKSNSTWDDEYCMPPPVQWRFQHVIPPWPWILTFWPQNITHSSLSHSTSSV